jgi:hypothetical protein
MLSPSGAIRVEKLGDTLGSNGTFQTLMLGKERLRIWGRLRNFDVL